MINTEYEPKVIVSFTVISLFSGAMGLDIGFENAGFEIRIASDIRPEVCKTISTNRPELEILEGDITDVPSSEILSRARLRTGEADLLIGGPPCQSFSTAGTRKSFNEKRGEVFFEFVRVIREIKPRFFIFENVKGIVSAALNHMSFYERIKKKEDELSQEQRLGSAFNYIQEVLAGTGYKTRFNILNAADYGTPQKRQRVIIIGSRDGETVEFPSPTHDQRNTFRVQTGELKPWTTLRDAFMGMKEKEQDYADLPSWGKYMKHVKPGGCWRDLPIDLQQEAMKGAFLSQGGRTGFFRRLSWDSPSPTLVTWPVFKGSTLIHPEYDRALSIQEYARLQGFPDDWKFLGNLKQKYRMIGEAVPIQLSTAIAITMRAAIEKRYLKVEPKRRGRTSIPDTRMV